MSTKTQTYVGVGAAAALGLVAALGIAGAAGLIGSDDEPAPAATTTTSTEAPAPAPPVHDEVEHGAPLATLKPYVRPVPVGDRLVDCVIVNAGGVSCDWAGAYLPEPLPGEAGLE